MRLSPLLLAVPAVLVMAAPAPAKGVSTAKVCGADGCRQIDNPDESMLMGGTPTSGPPSREPFVRLVFQLGDGGTGGAVRNLFAPRSGLVLSNDGTDTWLKPDALARLRREARRVTPFPASKLPAYLLSPVSAADRAPARRHGGDGGAEAWWIAVLSGLAALALALIWTRRRHSPGPASTA